MAALTILTTEIRQLDGLYSLNDLHQAAGCEAKHRPNYFLSNTQTKALIDELQVAGIPATKTIQGKGKQQGTYVCRELVIAYAAWISAAFHLKVIQVFLSQSAPKALPAPEPKRYNYPDKLLAQPYFTSSYGVTRLDIGMLANTRRFISPLFALLNELRADGHDVSAALAEAEAMREGIIRANDALQDVYLTALRAQNMPAKVALRGKR